MSKILVGHPINAERRERGVSEANVVLLRGCGSLSDLPTFQELHGLKSCVVAPTKIIAGKEFLNTYNQLLVSRALIARPYFVSQCITMGFGMHQLMAIDYPASVNEGQCQIKLWTALFMLY